MEEAKGRVKITELGAPGCAPCKDLETAIEKLAIDYDIDFVLIDADKITDFDDPDDTSQTAKEIMEVFGEIDGFPSAIIESEHRSKKITGFNEGELRAAIEEVLEPVEER